MTATRPSAIRADSRSVIACSSGRGTLSTIAATAAGSRSAASAFIAATGAGRISGGGIEMPWFLPPSSVNRSRSASAPAGRYQMCSAC